MSIVFLTVPSKTLAASIDAATYTFQSSDILGWDGNALTSGNFGSSAYVVFRSSDNKKMELMSIDPTTIASASITILKRGLSFSPTDLTTEVAANKQIWVKNDTIIELGSNPPQLLEFLKEYIDAAAIAGGVPATPSAIGLVKLSTTAANPALPVVVGDNDTRVPTQAQRDALAGTGTPSSSNKFVNQDYTTFTPPGLISPYAGRTAPSGWVLCDGSTTSRTGATAALFAVLCPSQTFTVTIASPGVVTATAHGLVVGDKIHFTTTGGLPSGMSTNTDYYVISAGLTANAFEFALSPSGTAVVTTGSQSGVHTFYASAYGKGDGSTTFNLPDLRGKSPLGFGATNNLTLAFEGGAVSAGADTVAVPDGTFPLQGQAVTLTSTGTLPAGLSTSTTYYVVRISSTSIKFASTQGNANAITPVIIDITDTGTAGAVHTIVYALTARTIIGKMAGEETHGLQSSELAGHSHPISAFGGAAGNANNNVVTAADNNNSKTSTTQNVGSDVQHNNMAPYVTLNYIIKT